MKAHDREITQQAKHAQDEVINEKRNCTCSRLKIFFVTFTGTLISANLSRDLT